MRERNDDELRGQIRRRTLVGSPGFLNRNSDVEFVSTFNADKNVCQYGRAVVVRESGNGSKYQM